MDCIHHFLVEKCLRQPLLLVRKKKKLLALHKNFKAIRFCCSGSHPQDPGSPGAVLALFALRMPHIPRVRMSWGLGSLISSL